VYGSPTLGHDHDLHQSEVGWGDDVVRNLGDAVDTCGDIRWRPLMLVYGDEEDLGCGE
jgi:hypothetical protein